MVPRRRLSQGRRSVGLATLAAAALAAVPAAVPAARAADARVAIGHYRWSTPVVHVDRGQHVTWYWVGPDTMHSVTGISSNDLGDDSDPHSAIPHHRIGDTYTLTFTEPGIYLFRCKMHPIVHGEVIVSDLWGNPADDPDPIPKPNVSLMRPTVDDLTLAPARFSTGGTTLHYALDDPASVDAEIWHVDHGRRGRYAGWETWHGHIGFNQGRFAARGPHFTPAPGRYVVYLQATDLYHNLSRTRTLRFTIRGRSGHGGRHQP